jgi:hypothetical protein
VVGPFSKVVQERKVQPVLKVLLVWMVERDFKEKKATQVQWDVLVPPVVRGLQALPALLAQHLPPQIRFAIK